MWWIVWLSLLGLAAAQVSERRKDGHCAERTTVVPADDVNDTVLKKREEWSLRNPKVRTPKCHSKPCCAVNLENVPRSSDVVKVGSLRFPTNETEPYGASGVTVCYPNAPTFITCNLWSFQSEEMLRDGHAIVKKLDTKARYELGEYVAVNGTFWVCVPPSAIAYSNFLNSLAYLYEIAYAISIVSLLATFIVQVSSKKRFSNQKAVLLSHVLSLLIGYTTLLVLYIVLDNTTPSYALCFALGLLKQFSFLAACSWLTILTLVHWQKFANFQSLVTTTNHFRVKLYLCQCLCGLGIPLVLCITSTSLHLYNTKDAEKSSSNCWITDKIILLTLFYGPMGLNVVFNLVLTIKMVYNIRKSSSAFSTVNSNHMHQRLNLLRLTLKLMAIIHLYWIFEIISWLLGDDKRHWAFLDIINALQGFFLFLIYTCKRDTFKKLSAILSKWWQKLTNNQSDTNKRHVSTSVVSRSTAITRLSSTSASHSSLETDLDRRISMESTQNSTETNIERT